ncbi:hypothetical protein OAJ27_01085 [bacterium]|nr:hypothetical protein [bacterium]
MKKIVCLIIWFVTSAVFAVDYSVPYLLFGGSPTYFLGSQSFSHDGFAVLENDAAPFSGSRFSTGVFHTTLYESLQANSAVIGMKFKDTFITVSGIRLADTDIPRTAVSSAADNAFEIVGAYGYENLQAKLSVSKAYNNHLRLGAGATFYQTKLDTYTGSANDVSVGAYFEGSWIDISGSIHNILQSEVNFSNAGTEKLPRYGSVALDINPVSWLHLYPRVLYIKSDEKQKQNTLLSLGMKWKPLSYFGFSGAFYEQPKGLEKEMRMALGTELNLTGLKLSYAYRTTDYKEASASHLASFSFQI